MNVERNQLLCRCLEQRAEAIQIINDVMHWNAHVRKPGERTIHPDPDGDLKRIIKAVEKMAETELWAIHAVGPDEFYATTSLLEGERTIQEMCRIIAADKSADNPNQPPFGMTIVPWPGTPKEHAAELRDQAAVLAHPATAAL